MNTVVIAFIKATSYNVTAILNIISKGCEKNEYKSRKRISLYK